MVAIGCGHEACRSSFVGASAAAAAFAAAAAAADGDDDANVGICT